MSEGKCAPRPSDAPEVTELCGSRERHLKMAEGASRPLTGEDPDGECAPQCPSEPETGDNPVSVRRGREQTAGEPRGATTRQ